MGKLGLRRMFVRGSVQILSDDSGSWNDDKDMNNNTCGTV